MPCPVPRPEILTLGWHRVGLSTALLRKLPDDSKLKLALQTTIFGRKEGKREVNDWEESTWFS